MVLRQYELGPMQNFVYLAADLDSKECAVVDPAWEVPTIQREASKSGWRITSVLLTHGHPDHTNGIAGLQARGGVPVFVHEADAVRMEYLGSRLRKLQDGGRVRIGESEAELLHTPGHTPGSACWLLDGRILTGDTLFVQGCGRVDLPGSDPLALYRSLKRIAGLPDDIKVFPGHNYASSRSSTVGVEKEKNPYIRAALQATPEEFASLVGP